MYYPDDTIVAISSGPGPAARGIIRLSGPDSLPAVGEVFEPEDKKRSLDSALPWMRLVGRCRLADDITCPAEIYIFRAPQSYTTQDMAELHLPGSPALLQIVLAHLLSDTIRPAEPGEFTARAFINQRIDLTEAEAVAAMINARSDAQLRAAERLLDGALHCSCAALAARLVQTLALVETTIDFTQEDIDLAFTTSLRNQVRSAGDDLAQLLRNSAAWDDLNDLPRVAILGRPNAGKSTLTNALTGLDRSIVSSIAGTTRDMLTAPLRLTNGECLLIDTAGLADTADGAASLEGHRQHAHIFEQAQKMTRRTGATCDLMLWVFDLAADPAQGDQGPPAELKSDANIIAVGNKLDLCSHAARTNTALAGGADSDTVAVSALTGSNLEMLKAHIEFALRSVLVDCPESSVALTTRQRNQLDNAWKAIEKAVELFNGPTDFPGELVALELRTALDHLGSISGQIVAEDILTEIFSRFCIGK